MNWSYLEESFSSGSNINKEIRIRGLKKIITILNNNNIDYFVLYGSLLGLIREGELLENDDDIDILVHTDNIDHTLQLMKNHNMPIKTSYANKIFIHESKDYGKIEIYRYVVEGKELIDVWTKQALNTGVFPKDFILPTKTMKFYDLDIKVPQYPEKTLDHFYKDWKTPTNDKGRR